MANLCLVNQESNSMLYLSLGLVLVVISEPVTFDYATYTSKLLSGTPDHQRAQNVKGSKSQAVRFPSGRNPMQPSCTVRHFYPLV